MTAPGLHGSLVPVNQHAKRNPQGPGASAEQHQPGQDPHPHLDHCSQPAVGACTTALQPAPELTESSELGLKLHCRNKSHLLKELIHEAVPVHTDGDFIIVVTVFRLQ